MVREDLHNEFTLWVNCFRQSMGDFPRAISMGRLPGGRGSLEAKTAIYNMQMVLEKYSHDPVSSVYGQFSNEWGLWNAMAEKKKRGERLFDFLAYFSSTTLRDEMSIFQ